MVPPMPHPLNGLSILIVEDEPMIAMDIAQAFEDCGSHVTITNTLRHAAILIEHDELSGAILDHSLGSFNSSVIYARLQERGIPFIIYTGLLPEAGIPVDALHVIKPATNSTLITAMLNLISQYSRRR